MIEEAKLEELMYLSLIGKFDFKNVVDDITYFGYTSRDESSKQGVKPLYITSSKVQSESVGVRRISNFEKKILNEVTYIMMPLNGQSYSRRIRNYIKLEVSNKDEKTQNMILKSYKNNMASLLKEGVIDKRQCEAAVEYVTTQLNKVEEIIL